MLGVGGCRLVWCCLALSIDIWFGFHVDPSSQHDVPAFSLQDSHLIQTDPTGSPLKHGLQPLLLIIFLLILKM